MYGVVWIPDWSLLAFPENVERISLHKTGLGVTPEASALNGQKFNDVMEIISSHVLHCAVLEPGLAVFIVPRTHTINQLAELLIGDLAFNLGLEAHIGCAPGVFAAVQAAYRDFYAESTAEILDDLSIRSLLCSYFPSEKYQRLHEFTAIAELWG
ncbi:hypothetical protein [Arcanobacterium buesumense]|uniref:Uncharacterized protein n=1 Tax=Arcanobacterium buesumense TaxID=2722751 RepID=A0A6H2EL24_9ACTO|nr:hypothetical protein [Arcanobacterium buesumense]QJC21823.1 hypothetical protein HC352_04440 [Arcanobacterium buesumense]